MSRRLPGPTLFTLLVLTIIVLTQDMLQFADLVLNRGLPAADLAAIALDRAIPALAWMVPFATLLGCLVALGRLASDGDLFLFEASGLSNLRLMVPMIGFALPMAVLGMWLSLDAAPQANRRLDLRLDHLARARPWANLQPGLIHRFGDWRLIAREISASGSELGQVQVFMPSLDGTIFAEHGVLAPAEGGLIELRLENTRSLLDPDADARSLRIDGITVELPGGGSDLTRPEAERIGGLSLYELLVRGDDASRMAFHRRFTWPVAAVLFAALSVPLFVRGGRGSVASGLVLGIGGMVTYQGLVQAGNGLLWSGWAAPVLAAWLPNAVLLALALLLPLRLEHRHTFGPRPETPQWLERLRRRRRERDLPRRSHRRALDRYVARSFLEMLGICLAGLLVLYLLVDVLERLDRFVLHSPTAGELLGFYAARLPLLASRVVPLAVLVATAITVSLVGARGELVAMRACGIPAWRGLLPVLLLSALAVPASFLLNDQVIPRTTALSDRINDLIKGRPSGASRVAVWYRDGDRFFEAEVFDPEAGVVRGLTVYELNSAGLPEARLDASAGLHVGDGLWLLEDLMRLEEHEGVTRATAQNPIVRLGDDVRENVETRHLSVGALRAEIGILERAGVDVTRFRVDLWAKLATPLASLLLPMLALFFSLGGPPYPSTAATLVLSAGIAVAFTLLTGLGASLGYAGTLSPAAAAFAPALLFAAVAAAMGRRMHLFR